MNKRRKFLALIITAILVHSYYLHRKVNTTYDLAIGALVISASSCQSSDPFQFRPPHQEPLTEFPPMTKF